MVINRNNMHDFPSSDIFKWMTKTFIAVILVTNTSPIMMVIFNMAQSAIANVAGVILTDTAIGVDTLESLRESLLAMDIRSLLGLYLQSFFMGLTVCIFIIVYDRMLEIYLMTALGAIPIAIMSSKEWNMGQSYIKSLLALMFQGLFIVVCVGIYAVLIQSIATDVDPIKAVCTCIMYTVLLCFSLFKKGNACKEYILSTFSLLYNSIKGG